MPRRGEVNSSPTVAQYNLASSVLASSVLAALIFNREYVRTCWNHRACASSRSSEVQGHYDSGRQKNAHVVSFATEGPYFKATKAT
jgi:hypothetical protein